ncbi:hypothetical protein DFH08DRAFT_801979 [Mycena albidolilacea]|uniref:Uncharacterized protein n=1 Tax=Mycena albidolilacea TaxID=1033008 RepID=A0AAD7EZ96_9AGAR|nr:hypothetical protein DFH08DRAFT_801979 [Mycena albidolilacea]
MITPFLTRLLEFLAVRTSFCDLHVELLQEIGAELSWADLKNLRAVPRHIRDAMEPVFYASATLVVDPFNRDGQTWLTLKTLVEGTCLWSRYGRLRIRSLAPKALPGSAATYGFFRDFVRPALQSLTQLRVVHWIMRRDDPSWAHRIVVDTLSAYDHLQELHMMTTAYDDDRFVAFPTIPRLRSLSVDQPTDWMVYVRCRWTAGFLAWIGRTIRASPQLESTRFPCTADDCAEGVSGPRSHDALYSYLASYSGILERLEIIDVQQSAHGKMLYENIISQNAASLVVLRLPGCEEGQEGSCALKSQQITFISQLKRLETLYIAVEGSGPGALRAVAYRFLETAVDSIPALKNIAILPAYSGGCNRSNRLDRLRRRYGSLKKTGGQRMSEDCLRRTAGVSRISREFRGGALFGTRILDVVVGADTAKELLSTWCFRIQPVSAFGVYGRISNSMLSHAREFTGK